MLFSENVVARYSQEFVVTEFIVTEPYTKNGTHHVNRMFIICKIQHNSKAMNKLYYFLCLPSVNIESIYGISIVHWPIVQMREISILHWRI